MHWLIATITPICRSDGVQRVTSWCRDRLAGRWSVVNTLESLGPEDRSNTSRSSTTVVHSCLEDETLAREAFSRENHSPLKNCQTSGRWPPFSSPSLTTAPLAKMGKFTSNMSLAQYWIDASSWRNDLSGEVRPLVSTFGSWLPNWLLGKASTWKTSRFGVFSFCWIPTSAS